MNSRFSVHIDRLPAMFAELMDSEELAMVPVTAWKRMGAIYLFTEDGCPVHVGRTRNLYARIRGHLSPSHFSASFVFKQARRTLDLAATYRAGESRSALFADPNFRAKFDSHSQRLRTMTLRYLRVDCPVDQYLLELYTAMELELLVDEFQTH